MEKSKKGLISKTLDRCRTMRSPARSKSWPRPPPEGCCTVYVGPEKERFVIKTRYLNHPLFKMLLDEAEMVYGFAVDGPLELPCEVELFRGVVWEVEADEDDGAAARRSGCRGFTRGGGGYAASAYRLLSPSRVAVMNRI
ncbi:hypothetical protein QJS10_CPB04g00173 [Acorus calamus]|uniref:Uncharacterized protein n=1 Tax=Acorus calamus TaxID=4465 RepID=A0AAV9F421_ACOCL|nr:hypothetical protein QJS10_CPB04g00173 [Acorus calamus]